MGKMRSFMVTKKRKMEKTDHKTYGQIKQVKTKTLRDKATLLKCPLEVNRESRLCKANTNVF